MARKAPLRMRGQFGPPCVCLPWLGADEPRPCPPAWLLFLQTPASLLACALQVLKISSCPWLWLNIHLHWPSDLDSKSQLH